MASKAVKKSIQPSDSNTARYKSFIIIQLWEGANLNSRARYTGDTYQQSLGAKALNFWNYITRSQQEVEY